MSSHVFLVQAYMPCNRVRATNSWLVANAIPESGHWIFQRYNHSATPKTHKVPEIRWGQTTIRLYTRSGASGANRGLLDQLRRLACTRFC